VATFYLGEADKPTRQAWVDSFAEALRQNDSGAYVGFLNDEGADRVRAAYPGSTWDRLDPREAHLRPGQPVPAQPEHPTRVIERAGAERGG
jgi:hypothetical protein